MNYSKIKQSLILIVMLSGVTKSAALTEVELAGALEELVEGKTASAPSVMTLNLKSGALELRSDRIEATIVLNGSEMQIWSLLSKPVVLTTEMQDIYDLSKQWPRHQCDKKLSVKLCPHCTVETTWGLIESLYGQSYDFVGGQNKFKEADNLFRTVLYNFFESVHELIISKAI